MTRGEPMTRPVSQRIRFGPRSECGITLAEILIAMTIISVGLVALAAVVPISSYGLQEGNQVSTATFLAEQRLEQLKAASWMAAPATDCLGTSGTSSTNWSFSGGTAPAPGGACTPTSFPDETPTGSTTATPSTRLSDPYGSYTRQVRIRPCDAAGAARLQARFMAMHHELRRDTARAATDALALGLPHPTEHLGPGHDGPSSFGSGP